MPTPVWGIAPKTLKSEHYTDTEKCRKCVRGEDGDKKEKLR